MKKFTYFLLLCLSIGATAQTNVYHPFPEADARWNFDLVNVMGACHYQYSLEVSGDTVINGLNYKRLISHGFVNLSTQGFCSQVLLSYLGAVRNDTAAKKVFFCPFAQSTEELLYDFNMQVGDTLTGVLNSYLQDQNTVYAKDSVLVNGSYRNRWMVDSCYSISIVEGIGSVFGLIAPLPGCITDGDYYQLQCYTENNVVVYPPNAGPCALIDKLTETDVASKEILLFPNPSNNAFFIESNTVILEQLALYDISGKLVRSARLNGVKKYLIEGLESGYYTLQLTGSDTKVYNKKLIKLD